MTVIRDSLGGSMAAPPHRRSRAVPTDPIPVVRVAPGPPPEAAPGSGPRDAPRRSAGDARPLTGTATPARYGIQMARRRPGGAWLAQTVTLGAGHIRWLRRTSRDLGAFDERAEVDVRRTTLAVVPGALLVVPACVAWFRLGRRIRRAQYAAGLAPTCRPGRGLLLAPLLGAITWYYQAELNKIVDWYGYPPDVAVPLYD